MKLKIIEVKNILANFYQPRTKFDQDKIKELTESILSNGLINPITVAVDKKRKGKYMIVSGERRWQAHRTAKIKTIQCVVKDFESDTQFMIESLIENVHREDLSSMETAKFIKKIWVGIGRPIHDKSEFKGQPNCTILATAIGINAYSVREYMSLVTSKTPKKVQKAVDEGKLAMRSATIMKKLPEKEQEAIATEAMKRETGMGRSEIQKEVEVREIKNEYGIESLELERTEQDIVNDLLSDLSNFQEHFNEMKKMGFDMFDKQSLSRVATSMVVKFSNILKLFDYGIKPDKRFLDLVKLAKHGKKIS